MTFRRIEQFCRGRLERVKPPFTVIKVALALDGDHKSDCTLMHIKGVITNTLSAFGSYKAQHCETRRGCDHGTEKLLSRR